MDRRDRRWNGWVGRGRAQCTIRASYFLPSFVASRHVISSSYRQLINTVLAVCSVLFCSVLFTLSGLVICLVNWSGLGWSGLADMI